MAHQVLTRAMLCRLEWKPPGGYEIHCQHDLIKGHCFRIPLYSPSHGGTQKE